MRRGPRLGSSSLAALLVSATVTAASEVPTPRPKPDVPGQAAFAPPQEKAAESPAAPAGKAAPPPKADAPAATSEPDGRKPDEPAPSGPEPGPKPALDVRQPPFDEAAAKACEADLTALGARFVVREAIADEGGCGAPRPLEVSAVGSVELRPPVVARCEIARALGRWVAEVVKPSATLYLGEEPLALATAGSYQCRARSGGAGKASEHAVANAVDVSGAEFARRGDMAVRDWTGSADPGAAFQAAIRGGACAYFKTVLGPGTDPDHADHLHMDLEVRENGYRICQ